MQTRVHHLIVLTGCENPKHKGDGLCDDGNNHAGCDFDGGDCCGFNVDTSFCNECACKGK